MKAMIHHAASMAALFVDQLAQAPVEVQCAQQAAASPEWKWWISALAPWVGPLLSGVVSIYVAWKVFHWQDKKEHRRWFLDQKRQEWRELLSALSACRQSWVVFAVLDNNRPSLVGGCKGHEVFVQAKQMIHDRLFIDAQRMAIVKLEWSKMLKDSNLPTDEQTEASFQSFLDLVLKLSKEDLHIENR